MTLSNDQKQRISDEEETLAEVHTSIEQQLSWSHTRLKTESARAQDLTKSIVAARRDTDKQMLASDEAVSHQLRDAKFEEIKTLNKLKEKPYFAHIVLEELTPQGTTKALEYKLGVAANPDCRIIDWRKAPIAKLYYEYKEGEEYAEEILGREREGTVVQRNKVDIDKGQLLGLSCGLGTFTKDLNSGEWNMGAGSASRRRRRGELPNVLQLITPDQFSMITEDAESAVLIQGIAGSGKTTVALYRLAWLLHEDNSDTKATETAIVVFSKTLRRYIQEALPALECTAVPVHTYETWAYPSLKLLIPEFFEQGVLRVDHSLLQPGVDRCKRSMAMLLRLEEYAQQVSLRIRASLQKIIDSTSLPSNLQRQVQSALHSTRPPDVLLEYLERELSGTAKGGAHSGVAMLQQYCSEARAKLRDIPAHLARIFTSAEKFLAFDESRLLDAELIRKCRTQLEQNRAEKQIAVSDIACILRLGQCLGLPSRRVDGANEAYRHLVVDEVQDFGAVELASLIASVKEVSQLTIVGDTSQQIDAHVSFPGWERLRSHWSLGDEMSQFHFLSVSHRSTAQIMKLADHVLGQKKRSAKGRAGKEPLWFHCRSEQTMVQQALTWLKRITEKFPDMLVAVLCRNDQEARYVASLLTPSFPQNLREGIDEQFAFDEGILVTTIREVKGLEFEAVLVWDCSQRSYPDKEWARRWLYVAITRAEEYVCLVSHKKPSPLLPSIHSPLVRGMLEEPEPRPRVEEYERGVENGD